MDELQRGEMAFLVLPYEEQIPESYSLASFTDAEGQLALVAQAYRSSAVFEDNEQAVRLKNGLVHWQREDHEDNHDDKNQCLLEHTYREGLKYKMIHIKPKSEGKQLTKEDCLIALAYAAEHDDVEEVVELVEAAGKDILKTRMPFATLGTILHVCTDWASMKTLHRVLTDYPEGVNVFILDNEGDTALHNVPNYWKAKKHYEDSKTAACLLLGLHKAVHATDLLSSNQNSYGEFTVVCKALAYKQQDVCRALLDAGKEMQGKGEATTSESSKWLTLKAHGYRIAVVCDWNDDDDDADDDDDDDAFCTALHLAVLRKYDDIVNQILAYPGAEGLNLTSLKDHNGNTPLHAAAKVGNPEICSMLLKYSVEINKGGGSLTFEKNNDGETPLHIASSFGHAEVCEKLLEYGASPSVPDNRGRYALTNAFAKNHKQVMKKLLDAWLIRKSDQDAPTPAKSEHCRSLDINEHFEAGLRPLHVAVAISSSRHIHGLIKAGASVDSTSDDGKTPLHIALERCDTKAADNILEAAERLKLPQDRKKGWVNMRDISGQTALHNMVRLSKDSAKDQRESSEEANSAMENPDGGNGITEVNNIDGICKMIKALLKEGAWVDVQDCDGETTLHQAMQSHKKVVETLLSYDMTKDNFRMGIQDQDKWIAMCDFSGETALHKATRGGNVDFVCRLLEATNSRDELLRVRDMVNMTALDWAALNKNEKMIDKMMENSSDITKSFLMWHLKECNSVHERYSSKKYQGNENQTSLLHAAVENKDVDIARELINKGADVTSLKYDARRWLAQNFGKKDSDLPTLEDTLGRKELVQGVATLLLNPYTQTPITIGIFGNWGTGKSSFMLQVEEAMLHMDVKEIFRKIPYTDKESSVLKFSRIGTILRCMVVKALKQRMKNADNYGPSVRGKELLTKIIKAAAQKRILKEAAQKSIPSSDIENQMPINAAKQGIPSSDIDNQNKDDITVQSSSYRKLFGDLALGDSIINNFPMDLQQSKYCQLFKDLASTNIPNLEKDLIKSSPMELQKKYRRLFKDLASIDTSKSEYDIINNFPMELQSKYRQLFKDLVLTDRSKLVLSHTRHWYKRKIGMNNQTLQDAYLTGYTPAVLTLRYNAWQYDNKTEASAGLAVEISHQLESFMTPHQWLRMCWKYSWNSRPREICVHLLLPCFLALVAICVVLILWKLVPISTKYKAISLPMGILGVMWAFFKTSLKAIQPVTQTMLNITKSIDHRSMLGYQHQVINDINFLKDQLCRDAHFGWKILSFFCQLFISNKYFMEGTWIWKQHLHLNNFRIVVFIDDLDRCDENTILELLRAVNLILGSCGINVVIGVDKGMVERAITREFLKDTSDNVFDILRENTDNKIAPKEDGQEVVENVESKTIKEGKESQNVERNYNIVKDNKQAYTREIAENYLQKIIQLPIQLPDPSRKHIEHFLQGQVGQHLNRPQKSQNNKRKENVRVQEKQVKDEGDSQSHISSEEHVEQDHVKDEGDAQGQEFIEEDFDEYQVKEGDSQDQGKIEDGASDPIVFRLLLANYTPMEKDMLGRLCKLATKERRVPREWKRFLNYHRLAWTIFSQDHELRRPEFKGWQRKLILWIFICWNWRDQMDAIFENWYDIISKSSKSQAQMHLLQDKDKNSGIILNLCDIISTYMEIMGWRIGKEDVNQNRGIQGGEIERKSWYDLRKIVKEEYDIPMHFIEKFQLFRFFCKLNYLEIDKQHKPKAI